MLRLISHPDGAAFVSPRLHALGVPHVFTTRVGEPELTLDLAGLGTRQLIEAKQVHGSSVTAPDARRQEADAVLVTDPKDAAWVRVADCLPALLASHDGKVVASVHAGWRGLLAGVLESAVSAIGRYAPGQDIVAALGPCISVQHFQVGEEVANAFPKEHVQRGISERPHVDLRSHARHRLRQLGVDEVDVADACTYEHEALLYSYRRDVTHGHAPRTPHQWAVIGPAPMQPSVTAWARA